MECNCYECDLSWKKENQMWRDSIELYIKQNNLHLINQMVLWAHPPINLLRLPCIKIQKKVDAV